MEPFFTILLYLLSCLSSTEAFDPLDPGGNIRIKWDVLQWRDDGYIASVSIFNFQQYRHIEAPGWTLGWSWENKEVIWSIVGGQAREQGDCSQFKGTLPHCCKKQPSVEDMLGGPDNKQIPTCCKGGVLASLAQDPANAASSFQMAVGGTGTTPESVSMPSNFTLTAPGGGYSCGPAKRVEPSRFLAPDGRRTSQALMTWNVTCTYSEFRALKFPTCCVSLSAFYSNKLVNCPACTCGCHNNSCVDQSIVSGREKTNISLAPLFQCSEHMCLTRVHWHVMANYKQYWRVKLTITNFKYMNFSHWNILIQHPAVENLARVFNFNYTTLSRYDDTAVLYGVRAYNDLLLQARGGNVQSDILFQKDDAFTFEGGWAFPRKVYFDGDTCVMLSPEDYPPLPAAPGESASLELMLAILLFSLAIPVIYTCSRRARWPRNIRD